jgi:hypothetical protein
MEKSHGRIVSFGNKYTDMEHQSIYGQRMEIKETETNQSLSRVWTFL